MLAILVVCRLLVITVLLSSGKGRIYELSGSVFMSLSFKLSLKISAVYFNAYV
jgi:preprotein translocase subunit SecG